MACFWLKALAGEGLRSKGAHLEGLRFWRLCRGAVIHEAERPFGAKGLRATEQTSHSPQRLLADMVAFYASVSVQAASHWCCKVKESYPR